MIHRTTNPCGCEYYGAQRTYACTPHLSATPVPTMVTAPHAFDAATRRVAELRQEALQAQVESIRCFRLGMFAAAEHYAQASDRADAEAQAIGRRMAKLTMTTSETVRSGR